MGPTTETYRLTINTYNTSYVQLTLNGIAVILNNFGSVNGGTPNLYADVDLV